MMIAALAGLVAAQGTIDAASPGRATASFYRIYLQVRPSGVPDASARARLEPVLTARLSTLLERAARAEAVYAEKTKGDSPPLVEGDVFTSLFEGAGRFRVLGCRTGPVRAVCRTDLTYASPGSKPARWRDTMVLIHTAAGWRVDDVVYGGRWAFGPKGSLSQALKGAIAEAAAEG